MKRLAITVAMSVMLASCVATQQIQSAIEVNDLAQYEADKAKCLIVAEKFEAHASFESIGFGLVAGAGDMISYAPLNWLMPLLGAIEGASKAIVAGFDVIGQQRANVYKHCLHDKLAIDRAAIIPNPDN